MQSIVENLPEGFSGANFETTKKHLHKLKRPGLINARYFKPVDVKGQIKYKAVTETTPGAQKKQLGKDLVHSQIVPQKISKEDIIDAISKVYVRPNAKSAQDILIIHMSKF